MKRYLCPACNVWFAGERDFDPHFEQEMQNEESRIKFLRFIVLAHIPQEEIHPFG